VTILEISNDATLRTLAINVLGKFLAKVESGNEVNNNLTYVALQALQTAATNPHDEKAVQRHRSTIIQCLNDADLSIRRRALEICVRLTNEGNFKSVSKELLNYLASATDAVFKSDLVAKIALSAGKFASDRRQYVDVILRLCRLSGVFVGDSIINGVIALVAAGGDGITLHNDAAGSQLQRYLTVQLLNEVRGSSVARDPRDGLLTLAVHAVGEWGDLVASDSIPAAELLEALEDAARLGLLQGQAVEAVGTNVRNGVTLCQTVATALAKLGAKLPKEYEPRISGILRKFENSLHPELQQRACEYLALAQCWPAATRRALIDKLSPGRAPQVLLSRPLGEVTNTDLTISAKVASAAAKEKLDIDDLLGVPDSGSFASRRVAPSGADSLLDILGEIAPESIEAGVADIPVRRVLEKPGGVSLEVGGRNFEGGSRFELRTSIAKFDWATEAIDNLVFEVAVPRYLKLTMRLASGASLRSPEAKITQEFVLDNDEKDKPAVFKFRLTYTQSGRSVVEAGQVGPF
jgi:AP-1 complex subunit gamma-1